MLRTDRQLLPHITSLSEVDGMHVVKVELMWQSTRGRDFRGAFGNAGKVAVKAVGGERGGLEMGGGKQGAGGAWW